MFALLHDWATAQTYPPPRREQQQQHAGADEGRRGKKDHRTAADTGNVNDDRDVPPGGEFSDGIAAAACSMQGWRFVIDPWPKEGRVVLN